MKHKIGYLLFSILVLFSSLSYGHGGRTDSNGGHYNRSTGVYHYHNGGYSSRTTISNHVYVMSIFHNKEFQGLGKTYNSKKECMSERYRLWKQNKSAGWTYGCRRS